MKKSQRWAAALLGLLLCTQLAACGAGPQAGEPETASAPVESAAPQAPEPSSAPGEAVSPEEEYAKVFEAVKPVAQEIQAALGEDGPTEEQDTALVEAAASAGVPVDPFGRGDGKLRNPQALVDFCAAVKAGREAWAALYQPDVDGLGVDRFALKDGKLTVEHGYWFYGDGAPDPEWSSVTELETVELWDNGWMYWLPAAGDESVEEYGYGVRVVPLDPALDGMLEKYVWYVDSPQTGVLSLDWDADSLDRLNWDYLFESLNRKETGKALFEVYAPEGTAYDDAGPWQVPAADVEALLTKYFPVTAERLRTLPGYRADTQTYEFYSFQGGGYSPKAEVVAKTDNPDGSFTLQIDWVSTDFSTPVMGRQYLTILPDAQGGYRYLSNRRDPEVEDNSPPWRDSYENAAGKLPEA